MCVVDKKFYHAGLKKKKIKVQISKDEADEHQAPHSMIPKTERCTERDACCCCCFVFETSANKAKTKSLTRMPTTERATKERDRTQMPVAKKERTDHKCWWQTKNGCPNHSSKQLTPNESNKTAELNHPKTPNGCLSATTRQGNRRSRTTPHKERMRGLVKHRVRVAHSYIVNERYNSRNKRASQEKKQ